MSSCTWRERECGSVFNGFVDEGNVREKDEKRFERKIQGNLREKRV
jgi:hypothetical protein